MTVRESPSQAGWDGILVEGEEILWQGRPDGQIVWRSLLAPETAFGVFFTGFAAVWIKMASWIGSAAPDTGGVIDIFPLFGLPFVLIGLYMIVGRIFADAYLRRGTHYTLTNLDTYIATNVFGRKKLKNYPISAGQQVTLEDGTPGSVWFATETVATTRTTTINGRQSQRTGTSQRKIGFRRIDDAREVYGIMRQLVRDLEKAEAAQTAKSETD